MWFGDWRVNDMEYRFNAVDAKEKCVQWIRDFFAENGSDCKAVLGISGGKDSSVAAALCVAALGKERVVGVTMPNGVQPDIEDSNHLCRHLGITCININIQSAFSGLMQELKQAEGETKIATISNQTIVNLPPRLRMATLYAVSQSVNGRVVNTCNYSEDYVGYSTRYGDAAGDFSPLGGLTKTEVVKIGEVLDLPKELIYKAPSDGLCGKTDEDNLGFTYDVLDKYIREGVEPEPEIKELIDRKHKNNLFKLQMMPHFEYAE